MKPMLCGSMSLCDIDRYVDDDQWVAQQKLDGDRLLVHVLDGKVTALNRHGVPRSNPVPAVVLRQFEVFPDEWVFDGELLTTGELWLFDLPFAAGLVVPEQPYGLRAAVLERMFTCGVWEPAACIRLLPTARSAAAKRTLVCQLQERGAEGLVFRHRDGLYRQGRRSELALKAKFVHTVDVVVDRVRPEGRDNCTFRLFRDGVLVPAGSCSLVGRPRVRSGDVIEVRYLYASDEGLLYQPVMLRVRHDKTPLECTVDQLRFTDRTVVPVGAYLRQRQQCRSGVTVELFDASHPDSEYDTEGGRWVTVCEHGSFAHHANLKDGRRGAAHPNEWCDTCNTH